jgi:alpha-1,2-mannosyltransferase
VLLLGLGALLLSTPAWFLHYSGLTAAVMAIVAGAGAQQLVSLVGARGVPRLRVATGAALVVALLTVSLPVAQAHTGSKFPGHALGLVAATRSGCVTSDHPSALILMDALSRNLHRKCRLVVDLGGASYDLRTAGQGPTTRKKNSAFQKYALRYLASGHTMVHARFRLGFGLSNKSHATVVGWPIVARADGYALRQPR